MATSHRLNKTVAPLRLAALGSVETTEIVIPSS